jgi:hypothetical protein
MNLLHPKPAGVEGDHARTTITAFGMLVHHASRLEDVAALRPEAVAAFNAACLAVEAYERHVGAHAAALYVGWLADVRRRAQANGLLTADDVCEAIRRAVLAP